MNDFVIARESRKSFTEPVNTDLNAAIEMASHLNQMITKAEADIDMLLVALENLVLAVEIRRDAAGNTWAQEEIDEARTAITKAKGEWK